MSARLRDKVVLITGGGTGIGWGIAQSCAREGAKVALAQRPADIKIADDRVAELQRAGRRALAIGCDITERAQVKAMIAGTVAAFGRLDVMVNNAALTGTSAEVRPFLEETDEHWRKLMDVNLDGAFICTPGSRVSDGEARRWRQHHHDFLGGAICRARKRDPILRRQSRAGRPMQRRRD